MQQIPDITNLSSLLEFENFTNDGTSSGWISTGDLDDAMTFSKIVEGFQYRDQLLSNRFRGLSRFMDDHLTVLSQALQATRNQYIHMLELIDSLKLSINKLEIQNQTQEVKMSSLEREMVTLLSACQNAMQELHMEISEILEFHPEYEAISSGLGSGSMEAVDNKQEDEEGSEYARAAEGLLVRSKKIGVQAQQLMNVNKMLVTSVDDLRDKLKQETLAAETAFKDRQLCQERLLKLEMDLEELQNTCSEMKVKLEENQGKEHMLRDEEAELSNLQNTLKVKGKLCCWPTSSLVCFKPQSSVLSPFNFLLMSFQGLVKAYSQKARSKPSLTD